MCTERTPLGHGDANQLPSPSQICTVAACPSLLLWLLLLTANGSLTHTQQHLRHAPDRGASGELRRGPMARRARAGTMSKKEIEEAYAISRRIEGEERALEAAISVTTSTQQEIDEQWNLYDGCGRPNTARTKC